jgi:hypothetical protein
MLLGKTIHCGRLHGIGMGQKLEFFKRKGVIVPPLPNSAATKLFSGQEILGRQERLRLVLQSFLTKEHSQSE